MAALRDGFSTEAPVLQFVKTADGTDSRSMNWQCLVSNSLVIQQTKLTDSNQPEAVFGQEDLKDGSWPTAASHRFRLQRAVSNLLVKESFFKSKAANPQPDSSETKKKPLPGFFDYIKSNSC